MPETTPFPSEHSNRSMPAAAVVPVLHYPDVAAASAWLCRAFGFSERLRIGAHRIQLAVGDGAIVVARAPNGAFDPARAGHSVTVRVHDADRHSDIAKAAGARIESPPASQPYGERQYTAIDPGGHAWTFSQTLQDTEPSTWGGELAR